MTSNRGEMQEISIRVAICGNGGSGRTSLSHRLDQFLYSRPKDSKIFKITAQERELGSDIFPDFDFAIFTFVCSDDCDFFDMRDHWTPFKALISAKYPGYNSKICFVGTKVDLVTPNTAPHVLLQCLPSSIAFLAQVEFRSVSSVTGAGLTEIVYMIADSKAPLPVIERRRPQPKLYQRMRNKVLDMVASWFALTVPEDINKDTPDLIHIASDDIVDTMHQSPESMAYNSEYGLKFGGKMKRWNAYHISPTLIALPRMRRPTAWGNAVFARSQLRIPIPQPRYPHLDYWFISEYVPGKLLMECWDSLSLFMKFRVACTLRGYIAQMRSLTRQMPGSVLGGYVTAHLFHSFSTYNGPFQTVQRFNQFVKCATYQGWAMDALHALDDQSDLPLEPNIPDDDDLLVFTHADIHPANLILTDDGILWMIDWTDSGFYPPWVENMGMYAYENAPESWKRFLWLMVVDPLHPINQYGSTSFRLRKTLGPWSRGPHFSEH